MSAGYGEPTVKIGRDAETSFVLRLDTATIDMLTATHPDTFRQAPHHAGYAAAPVRIDRPDDDLVGNMVARACERACRERR